MRGHDAADIRRYFDKYLKYVPGWAAHFARDNLPPAEQAPHRRGSPEHFQLSIRQGQLSATATLRAAADKLGADWVSLGVTLYRDRPFIDLTWSIENKRPDPWPEAGWLCLPLAIHEPRYRLGRLGSIVDPTGHIVPGSNFDVFCLTSGMTVAGPDGAGIGLCLLDSPLVSIGQPGLYRHTAQFGDRKPTLFVNLFNNVWGTNFQQWLDGSWSCRLRLWTLPDADQIETGLITPAWEARNPLIAAWADSPRGNLPPVNAGLQLSRKGVLATAFGPNPDGPGIIIRLWEQVGSGGPIEITLPEGLNVDAAQPVDLRGRPKGQPLPVKAGTIRATLNPFAPLTLRIAGKKREGR